MSATRGVIRVGLSSDGAIASRSEGDELTAESPLNLVLGGRVIATLMRTPGHDVELAAGWLVVESGVRQPGDLVTLRQCRTEDDLALRSLDGRSGRGVDQVHLALQPSVAPPVPRAWVTGSSCGVCSADVLDVALLRWAPPRTAGWSCRVDVLAGLPETLRARQRTFARTGSLHAAGLATAGGALLVVREDVGRHNAVDKVTGWTLLGGTLPATDLLLVITSRVSFEMVQKAVAAGVAGIVAVSAPTDLAVDLAREQDLLLAGMIRPGRMNLYAGAEFVTGLG
jgi:FdhD protein